MMTAADALVIMTKVPAAGMSKTRLVPPLSFADAAGLARALLLDQLQNVAHFTAARLYVAFAPGDMADEMRALAPAEFRLFPQRGSDLGERMANAFADLINAGFKRVVLIGSDLPPIALEIFTEAFESLTRASPSVVLGPSADGGYYLVGLNEPLPAIFDGITWSHPDVLERTRDRLFALRIPYKLLPSCYDIDTIDDLRRLALGAVPPSPDTMKNTSTFLRQLRLKGVL